VTNGAPGGTCGADRARFWRAALLIAGLVTVICTLNILSNLHDLPRLGHPTPAWEPITWEATSGLTDLVGCALIWLAVRLAPPDPRRWRRMLLVHVPGVLIFSIVHVGGMWALRVPIYAAVGARYRPPLAEALYEFRKDVLAYIGFATIIWLATRSAPAAPLPPPPRPNEEGPREAWFDIREGARILRVPLGEILAVRAAGNYVEFMLADGRRPLMRAPLGEIEASLSPSGFLRTHRSWVVNAARVRGLEPAGSGDYQLTLEGGERAPVSRRFPQALDTLRRGR
jgi:hypothetical protein